MYETLAAIDIGSNTVHLIVAVTDGNALTILADESIFVRLANGVWNQGYIPDERILTTAQAIYHLREVARSFGVEHIVVVATEVARTARNTLALLNAVEAVTGLRPIVLSGMDEATLMFQGVTHARRLPSSVAVADLGGGSLEIILAELGFSAWRTSQPLGSAFLHDRFITHDPPLDDEVRSLNTYLKETFLGIPNLERVTTLIVCGGTVNALKRLVQTIKGRAAGETILTRQDIEIALTVMLHQPFEIVAADYRLRVERARLLPTGALVLAALLDHLHLSSMVVSQAGIREGIILAMARYGQAWLDGAHAVWNVGDGNAMGTTPLPSDTDRSVSSGGVQQSATAMTPIGHIAGTKIQQLVQEVVRARKKAGLGDSEAIHAMRVATRRLRTALETFAPCFPGTPQRMLAREVRRLAQALGKVRDADVAIAQVKTRLQGSHPAQMLGLRAVFARQVAAHRAGRQQLQRMLRKRRMERIVRYAEALRPLAVATDSPVGQRGGTIDSKRKDGR